MGSSAAPSKKQPKPVETKSSGPSLGAEGQAATNAAGGDGEDFGFDDNLFGETSADATAVATPSQAPSKGGATPSSAPEEGKGSTANEAGAAAPADESNPFGDGFFDDGAEAADNPFEEGGGSANPPAANGGSKKTEDTGAEFDAGFDDSDFAFPS
mmetsp:Transcript_21941/g.30739  ORF Transcript_21941/g.30739 Transcript_21941/m.30739 type:complete len:156 (+) Transcript_21941:626-1093(+)